MRYRGNSSLNLIGSGRQPSSWLRELIAERVAVKDVITMEVGPVIGTHTGPGMLAVVALGRVLQLVVVRTVNVKSPSGHRRAFLCITNGLKNADCSACLGR